MIKVELSFVFVMLLGLSEVMAQAPVAPGAPPGPTSTPKAPSPVAPANQSPFPNSGQPADFPRMDIPSSPAEVIMRPTEGLSARDPFRLPEELVIKLRQKNAMSSTGGIDPSVEAIRRFPLASYQLVGIIWDVKKPKAMFMDRLNSIHMVQVNEFIGNAKGVVVSIQSGAVTVLEGKIPQIIKLKK